MARLTPFLSQPPRPLSQLRRPSGEDKKESYSIADRASSSVTIVGRGTPAPGRVPLSTSARLAVKKGLITADYFIAKKLSELAPKKVKKGLTKG
jgi:hypothetical protein